MEKDLYFNENLHTLEWNNSKISGQAYHDSHCEEWLMRYMFSIQGNWSEICLISIHEENEWVDYNDPLQYIGILKIVA